MWKRALKRVLPAALVEAGFRRIVSVPESDGTVEAAGMEVMHFTLQTGFLTRVPSLYVPQDLQHLHLPECFTLSEVAWREAVYPALCRQASIVVALTSWGKRDLEHSYRIPPEKVRVVPYAPIVDVYPVPAQPEIDSLRERHHLPAEFLFFPATTFRHKNHLRLLDAVATLRDRHGVRAPIVFSGGRTDFFPAIEHRVRELKLGAQATFLGYVPPADLQCLYRSCRGLVFPSLFEGFGMPVLEAFRLGVPVACSNAPSLPELTAGAALLFDPGRTDAVAAAVLRLWTDEELRASLVRRGRDRARQFDWRTTAEIYRALYRQIAGRTLSARDRQLLAAPPAASVPVEQ